MNLSTFQAYLTSKAPLPTPPRHYLNGEEQQLLKWAASLPMQSEEEQASQLEKILTELSVADLDDDLRLRLMSIVMTATERLIAALRKHYIYEVGPLSDHQLEIMDQVKSLYYLHILVFDGVVGRKSLGLNYQPPPKPLLSSSAWKRLITPARVPSLTLAIAIYQSLLIYQKLLSEKAICYQPPPLYIWSELNQLYHLACQHNITHTDLSVHMVTKQATSIHQLYGQVCLHSLLNVLAMRRPSILLIQRLLPEWAAHISATLEPQTHTRVFIDLKSDNPPEYLTAVSDFNPYEKDKDCLFIELEPLAAYLRQRQHELLVIEKNLTEYRLVTKILMAITHRYIARQTTKISKYSPKKRATVITGFNDIHYRVAESRSLLSMVVPQDLALEYLPRYDTAPRKDATSPVFEIEMYDCTDTMSHFRTLRLLTAQDIVAQQGLVNAGFNKQKSKKAATNTGNLLVPALTDIFEPITMEEAKKSSDSVLTRFLATAPPRLQIMSLFLLNDHQEPDDYELENKKSGQQSQYTSQQENPQQSNKENLSLGIVRWLTIDEEYIEVEGQVLGHAPTACALRLESRDNRSQSFIPALLLAAEEVLQSPCSLLVPSYHFNSGDKVMIRLNGKQTSLRLQRSLLSTEAFTQYEVIRL